MWEDSDDGAAAYAAFFLWLALGSWPALQSLHVAGVFAVGHSNCLCGGLLSHQLHHRNCLSVFTHIYADLPYFLGLGVLTTYIGAHRGLTSKSRQQLTVKEVREAAIMAAAQRETHFKQRQL